jgi:hypothetical protein
MGSWNGDAGPKGLLRKAGILVAYIRSGSKKALPTFSEITGFVNDRGAMRHHLTTTEQAERDEFAESI